MNVVPIDQPDTLPVIFNRGLIGAYHDWCESFNTYPRTYDLLHMSNLVASLTTRWVFTPSGLLLFVLLFCLKPMVIFVSLFRCDIIEVAAEIDRILRPGRWFVLKDKIEMIKKMRPVLKSLHYETVVVKKQFLAARKSFWRPGKPASRSGWYRLHFQFQESRQWTTILWLFEFWSDRFFIRHR